MRLLRDGVDTSKSLCPMLVRWSQCKGCTVSEYQWIGFGAIEEPLSDDALEFMETQSSRADIDRWSFHNEYTYGDFQGDTLEMLRRGYDFYVHFANFGVRYIAMRFRDGFAYSDQLQEMLPAYAASWYPDQVGTGGILEISPDADAGSREEEWWETDSLLSDLMPIREMIQNGDLRPLFLLNLVFNDQDETELAIPPGLNQLSQALECLAEFYEIDSFLIAASAKSSASMPSSQDDEQVIAAWLAQASQK